MTELDDIGGETSVRRLHGGISHALILVNDVPDWKDDLDISR